MNYFFTYSQGVLNLKKEEKCKKDDGLLSFSYNKKIKNYIELIFYLNFADYKLPLL